MEQVTWIPRPVLETRLLMEIQLVLKHCQLAILYFLCVYTVYLISNTKTNKQARLRFHFVEKYAHWAYFCRNCHQLDTRLVMETRLLLEVLR